MRLAEADMRGIPRADSRNGGAFVSAHLNGSGKAIESTENIGSVHIAVASTAGFCFGVKRAVRYAERLAEDGGGYTLGQIIHNPFVVSDLEKRGVKAVESLDEISDGKKSDYKKPWSGTSRLRRVEKAGNRIHRRYLSLCGEYTQNRKRKK